MKEIFGFLIICILSMFTTVEVALTEEVSSDIRSLKASGDILSLSFSPDGKILASGSQNGEIKLWDVATGKEQLSILSGYEEGVKSLAFSPDAKLLASGEQVVYLGLGENRIRKGKGNVILWDINTGEKLQSLPRPIDAVYSVIFSPDGKLLASRGLDKLWIIWDLKNGKALLEIEGVSGITFDANSEPLALFCSKDCKILKFLKTNQDLRKTDNIGNAILTPIAFTPNAERVAWIEMKYEYTGFFQKCSASYIIIWNIATGKITKISLEPEEFQAPPSPLIFNLDGKLLAGRGRIGTGGIRIWDAQTGDEIKKFTSGSVNSLAFSPKGDILASGHSGGEILFGMSVRLVNEKTV